MTERNPGDTIPTDSDRTEPRSVCVQPQATNTGVVSGQTSRINAPPETIGDKGETSLLSDPHRIKSDLPLIRRAIRNHWPITLEMQARLVERTMELVDSEDDRIAVGAVRVGVAIVDANIRVDLEEDKAERLDAGLATERVDTPVRFIKGTDGEGV